MGTRPLTSEERLRIGERLENARKRQELINQYVARLKQKLEVGTCWCLSQEDHERINREVAEIVQHDKEMDRLLEIKWYGHELTDEERRLCRMGAYPVRANIS